MVVFVSNSAPNGILSMSHVTSSLLNEEIRRKTIEINNSQSFVTEKRGRSKSRGPKGGRDKFRGKSYTRKMLGKCFHCGKQGHIKNNFLAEKNKRKSTIRRRMTLKLLLAL